jgi:Domain of unknown function (DUF397)
MMRHDLPQDLWQKSSYSSDNGPNCVETQLTPDGYVAVGDSKDRSQGAFTFRPHAWEAFVNSVKSGHFDL